jgi:C-8 sterol isomerase
VLNEAVQYSLKHSAAQGGNTTVIVDTLLDQLVKSYPDAGFNTDWRVKEDWVFNNAAGAMGSMYIIHASITE